ncbi:MAG: class I SAM-dependent methyltransferase [Acidimicrobiia bacterium]
MDEQIAANLARWDELVGINAASDLYDVADFKSGTSSLDSIQIEELGDVSGKSVLHLLCHLGLDGLSLAREGATVTGMDFSQQAVDFAQGLADELGLDARFICSDMYDLPNHLDGQFDIVLMSYGVVGWLKDLDRWAEITAGYLKPGGSVHVVEFHPFAEMFDDRNPEFVLTYPYFRQQEAVRTDWDGAYADPTAKVEHTVAYSWQAGIGDLFMAVLRAGLRIESYRELPTCNEQLRPGLVQGADKLWRTPDGIPDLPITYALKASKPA